MLELALQETGKIYLNREQMQIINPENPTLVLDGKEHEIEKLDYNAKYYINQVKDLNAQMTQLKAKIIK